MKRDNEKGDDHILHPASSEGTNNILSSDTPESPSSLDDDPSSIANDPDKSKTFISDENPDVDDSQVCIFGPICLGQMLLNQLQGKHILE